MSRMWSGSGPQFSLDWGGRSWTLDVNGHRPGLCAAEFGPLLALEGVAEVGRWDPDALSGETIVGYEVRHGRVESTYAPKGWGSITARAAWSPWHENGVDLEVELSAKSVGELRRVEVRIASLWPEVGERPGPTLRWVEPRDARSAGLSYDGREVDLLRLTTLPPRESAFLTPRLVSSDDGWLYAEMVHPQDVTRRIRQGGRTLALSKTTRYGLFGHDLEKGVVLRGRLRGLWLPADTGKEQAFANLEEFLHEPPPLAT
jgi:hypothetical protein